MQFALWRCGKLCALAIKLAADKVVVRSQGDCGHKKALGKRTLGKRGERCPSRVTYDVVTWDECDCQACSRGQAVIVSTRGERL